MQFNEIELNFEGYSLTFLIESFLARMVIVDALAYLGAKTIRQFRFSDALSSNFWLLGRDNRSLSISFFMSVEFTKRATLFTG